MSFIVHSDASSVGYVADAASVGIVTNAASVESNQQTHRREKQRTENNVFDDTRKGCHLINKCHRLLSASSKGVSAGYLAFTSKTNS